MTIVFTDVLNFIIVLLPVIFLTHLAFRIGFAEGRSRGGTLLLVGSSTVIFSFLLKMYFDFVFGSIDTFWLFVLAFITAAGLILAFAGTSVIHSFLDSTRSGGGQVTTNAARIAGIIALAFTVILVSYFLALDRPIYLRLRALCFVLGQVALFGIGIFIGEFFHLVGKQSASRTMRFARIITSYYLVEPVLLWSVLRDYQTAALSQGARVFISLLGVVVSSLIAAAIIRYVRLYLPTNLRRVKTTYLDRLRVKVLRDFYTIGICIIVFVSIALLAAQSLYQNLRISTIESYAEFRSSVTKLVASQTRSALEDVMLKLRSSESSPDPELALNNFLKNHDDVDAVGNADEKMHVSFFRSNETSVSKVEITAMLNSGKAFEDNGDKISLYHGTKDFKFFILIKGRGKYDANPYAFAVVDVRNILSNSMVDLNGLSLRLISPALEIVYSNREGEIGGNFKDAILADDKLEAKGLGVNMQTVFGAESKGYEILKGYDHAGVWEYFILIAAPVEFQGYKGTLATVEPEESVSGLFRPTNSLLMLSGFLVVGLFGGGLIIMSVAFRWSMRLENEVQDKINELRSSEDKYRRIVENPYIGSFIMVDGRVIFSNTRLAEILETDVERLSGSDLSVFVDGDDYASLKNAFDSIIQGGKFGDKWQVAGTTASGKGIKLSGYSSIIKLGNKRGVQSLVVDSTMEFQEKEKFEQFERLESMATLAAGIAHDFNNILQVVLGSSQLLQHKLQERRVEEICR